MPLERHALGAGIAPGKRCEYLRLHSAVWPQVEQTLTDNGFTNYTIFNLEDTLFAYYEYVGADHAASLARIADDPTTQEWWTHTDPCQVSIDDTPSTWSKLDDVWHLP